MFELVTTSLLSAVLLAAPPPETAKPAGSAAVVAVADAYRAASLKGDTPALMRLYADDAVEMPPGLAPIRGRAAIEQFYRRTFEGPAKIASMTFDHVESRTEGDIGYDVGTYRQTMTGAPAGTPAEDSGKYVVILKRSGGQWKVVYAIYNSDMAPPAAGATTAR